MKVLISGRVTPAMIAASGFTPTSYVTNGLSTPPASNLRTDVYPPCPKQPDYSRVQATHYTMANQADAAIIEGRNDHLYKLCNTYKLPTYAPAYDAAMDADLFGLAGSADDLFGSGGDDLFGTGGSDLFAAPQQSEPNLFA